MRNLEKYFLIEDAIKNENIEREKLDSFLTFYNAYIKENLEESEIRQKSLKKFIMLLSVSFIFLSFVYFTLFDHRFVLFSLCAVSVVMIISIIYKKADSVDKKDLINFFFERLNELKLKNKKQKTLKETLHLIIKDKEIIENKINNSNLELSNLESNLDIGEIEAFLEKNKNNRKNMSKIKGLTEKIYNYEENKCKRLHSEINAKIYDIKKRTRETIQTI